MNVGSPGYNVLHCTQILISSSGRRVYRVKLGCFNLGFLNYSYKVAVFLAPPFPLLFKHGVSPPPPQYYIVPLIVSCPSLSANAAAAAATAAPSPPPPPPLRRRGRYD